MLGIWRISDTSSSNGISGGLGGDGFAEDLRTAFSVSLIPGSSAKVASGPEGPSS